MIAVVVYQRTGESSIQQLSVPFTALHPGYLPFTLPEILANRVFLFFETP
jgi:hypothetical protein